MERDIEITEVLKKRLLVMFKKVIEIMDKNEIEWWAAYGTAIGAVRHGGFIPWDDDLDIHVRYTDLPRLFDLKDEFEKAGITILRMKDDLGYYLPYPNFIDMNTTIWEVKQYPYLVGLSIDIFPLYSTNMSMEEQRTARETFTKLTRNVQYGIQGFKSYDFLYLISGFHLKTLKKRIRSYFTYRKGVTQNIKKLHDFENDIVESNGEKLIFPFTYMSIDNYFEAEWFNGFKTLDFNGISVKVPINFDAYLTRLYGNYMQLPPIEKQKAHHTQEYVNLKERLNLKEVRRRMKMGERFEF